MKPGKVHGLKGKPNCNRGKGKHLKWLREHSTFDGPDCLFWPGKSVNWNGYAFVSVEGRMTYAHRVMCELVNGPPPPKHVAAHSCHNGHMGCVHPKHLNWKTPRQNLLDRHEVGTVPGARGEKWMTNGSKLSIEEIQRIKELRGKKNQREIAVMFGVTYQHVSAIQNGRVRGGQRFRSFTAEEIRDIVEKRKRLPARVVAEQYGVHPATIYRIESRIPQPAA